MWKGTGRVEIARSRPQFILITLSGLAGIAVSLALPAVLGGAIDAIVTGGHLGRWLASAAALIAAGVLGGLVDTFAGAAYTATAAASIRDSLVSSVLSAGPHRLAGLSTGDLVSRISGNAGEAAQAPLSRLGVGLAVIPPTGSLVLLALIDFRLALAFLAGLGAVVAVLRSFSRHTTAVAGAYQRAQGRIAGRLAEALGGARTIAAAGTIGRERERILEPLADLRAHGMKMWRVLARSTAQAAVAGPLILVAVLAAAGLMLAGGQITAGEMFAAARYAVIGAGLGSLTGVLGVLARGRAATDRIGEVTRIERLRYGTSSSADGTGRLDLRGVTVHGLLHDIDLSLPGGSTIAVVGRSGSGKSILAALAARLRDPDEGEILLDGVPLPDLRHDSLRRAVGCAFERPVLFGGTVADAIGLGREFVRVPAVAAATHAHDFIVRLPHGYDTMLADAPMSGGEAQRLGLARAWAAERLLVLDDATSSLDMVTELKINSALLDRGRHRTRLIVTHRATTAARADLVVWLSQGRVRAVAPHDVLWTEPGYRSVFE